MITATVKNYVKFSGDFDNEFVLASAELEDSPAIVTVIDLASGNNVITLPDVEDLTIHGVVVIPPNGNTIEPTVKGTNADTGLTLSATEASVIQFGATPPATFTLSVSETTSGFRLIYF